jgi:hypothetical protein
MNTYNIRILPKNTFSLQKDVPKYYLSYCQDKITNTNPNTNGWINIIKTLNLQYHNSDFLLAILEEHKDIVVKIGDDESIRKEYEISNKINGFVKFICCNCESSQIIMPYFELGSIGFYSWTNENINLLRTCIKHSILTYISAFVVGYLHGDFHPGNVLLKKTKQTSISYLFDDIGEISNIETNGMRTWIMDFENTREINKNNNADLLDFYFDIQKFFILLQDQRFIRNIDKTSTVPLLQIINHYMNHLLYPDLNFIHKVLHYIENISLL